MSKRKWIQRTDAQWQALFESQRRSGLTIDAFCRREGISVSSFNRRRAMLRSPEAFVELPSLAAALPVLRIELDLGAGVVLRISR